MCRRLFSLVLLSIACIMSGFVGPCAGGIPPTPTPTPLPWGSMTPPPDSEPHTFHVNLILDHAVRCPGDAKCDMPCVPRVALYLRGDLFVTPGGGVRGNGILRVMDVAPCVTLDSSVSSCSVRAGEDGAFTVSGRRLSGKSDDVCISMRLMRSPRLDIVMTTRHPVAGAVSVPFGDAFDHLLRHLLAEMKLFDVEIDLSLSLLSGKEIVRAPYFEGEYSWNGHVLHGYGSLFFIAPGTPLP